MAQQRLALNIGIGATVNSSLGKSFDRAQRESSDLAKNYEKINNQLTQVANINKYERQLKALNRRIAEGNGDTLSMLRVKEKLERQLDKTRRTARRAGVDMRDLAREERTLAWKAKQAKKQQDMFNDSLRETQKRARDASEATRKAAEAAKKAKAQSLRGRAGAALQDYGGGTRVGGMISSLAGGTAIGGAGLAVAGLGGGAVAAGGLAFAAAVRVSEEMDAINRQAKQLGVTTTALQELQYAAQTSTGLSGEDMYTALQDQAERISEAAMLGTGEAVDVLAALNLDAAELNKLSPDEQMMKIAEAMEKVDNQNDKQQLAIKMWSDTGAKLVNIVGSAKELQRLRDDADIIPESAIKNAEAFNKAFISLKGTIGAAFAAVMGPALPWFTERMQDLRGWIRENREGIAAFAGGVGRVASILLRLGKLIFSSIIPPFKLLWKIISPILNMLADFVDMLLTVTEKAFDIRDSIFGSIPGLGSLLGLSGEDETASPTTSLPGSATLSLPDRQPVGGNSMSFSPSNSMIIQTQPGQDPEQIGSIVMQKMEERDQQQARQFRGSMFDLTPSMI